jgi:hypothetical protein
LKISDYSLLTQFGLTPKSRRGRGAGEVREMAGKMLDVIERSRKQRKADRS